ncbi:MAG: phytoene desaturase family protein [Acidimicrobiales bacterium]
MDDAVVIGAGPNGLVAANHLADAGWSVTVLEAASEPGGTVRTGELTVPGFRHDLFSAFYPLAAASPAIRSLRLEEHGLRWRHAPLVLAHPLPDGRCAALSTDLDATASSMERFAPGDGAAWRQMIDRWRPLAGPFVDVLFRPFPPVVPAARLAARLGPAGTARFVRHLLLPARRMAEELFAGEGAGLLLGGNALHTDLSPESAGSGLFGWLLCCLGQQHGYPVPEGGAAGLSQALVRRLAARGGTVLCDRPVVEVLVRAGRAVGARTAAGDVVEARRAVLADVPAPALYGGLVPAGHLPPGLLADIRHFQWDMGTVKIDWALDGPVPWVAEDARRAGTVHVADDFDNLTEFAASIAMRLLPARPFLIFGQQSVSDPTRSPPGTDTAWAYTHVPRVVRGDAAGLLSVDGGEVGWLEGFVDRLGDRIEALAPGFRSLVRARHVWGPDGLEAADANLFGGAINGGTSQLHQQLFLRPVPGSGRAETPVVGLYLASASAHPGGGVHGAAGANAARAALLPAAGPRSRLLGRGRVGRRDPSPA